MGSSKQTKSTGMASSVVGGASEAAVGWRARTGAWQEWAAAVATHKVEQLATSTCFFPLFFLIGLRLIPILHSFCSVASLVFVKVLVYCLIASVLREGKQKWGRSGVIFPVFFLCNQQQRNLSLDFPMNCLCLPNDRKGKIPDEQYSSKNPLKNTVIRRGPHIFASANRSQCTQAVKHTSLTESTKLFLLNLQKWSSREQICTHTKTITTSDNRWSHWSECRCHIQICKLIPNKAFTNYTEQLVDLIP